MSALREVGVPALRSDLGTCVRSLGFRHAEILEREDAKLEQDFPKPADRELA